MCHAVNAGVLRALTEGVACSTTLMVPCPWSFHARQLLKARPALSFGIHLTLICETVNYGWSPLIPRDHAASLVNENGWFYSAAQIPEFQARARLEEVEAEFRAQIETVLADRLAPTHLDWHCLARGGRPDIFEMTLRLAREYGLAVRVAEHPLIEQVQRRHGLPTIDHQFLDSFRLEPTGKAARYAQLLRELPQGLTEWAVHPAVEDAELLTLEPEGKHVRQTDLDFLMSVEARQIIAEEGIILLSYAPLQQAWRAMSAADRTL